MTQCLVCREQRETTGVACSECLDELKPLVPITPEQITMRGVHPTPGALVDPWGRVHRLHRRTAVGREHEGDDSLCVLDATISRKHAVIEHGDTWTLRDVGSANGTYVEDKSTGTATLPIKDGERLRFGSVAFFFLDDVGSVPQDAAALDGYTVRGPITTPAPAPAAVKDLLVELRQPTGGGAGVALFDGKAVQLTLPQFEFVSILWQRVTTGAEPDAMRGFVHPSELIRSLSLESTEPSEDHVRQLVRRLRRVLFKAGIENLIESRYGAGYRLRLRPM